MEKKVLSIGFDFPGDVVQTVKLNSKDSLLDGDILIFVPSFTEYYSKPNSSYKSNIDYDEITKNSAPGLSENLDLKLDQLRIALEHGKNIFVFLPNYEEFYMNDGKHVDYTTNYSFLPPEIGEVIPASGSEIKTSNKLGILTTFWHQFKRYSSYKVYFDKSNLDPIFTTKVGNKIVGSILCKNKGAYVLLPYINTPEDLFSVNNSGEKTWTDEGKEFGEKLLNSLRGIDTALKREQNLTAPPPWVSGVIYKLKAECEINSEIEQVSQQILCLQEKEKKLKDDLEEEITLRYLLYEQGKPLEKGIIKSLKILGFEAEGYQDPDSEFDAVFNSCEGRFLGEAEGKDDDKINIKKYRQLVLNVFEDSIKDGVENPAKGVIFGNAYRLTEIDKRENDFFTEKCLNTAKLQNLVLVKTPDLFFITKYIKENNDLAYAGLCRKVFFETKCGVIKFPPIPNSDLI